MTEGTLGGRSGTPNFWSGPVPLEGSNTKLGVFDQVSKLEELADQIPKNPPLLYDFWHTIRTNKNLVFRLLPGSPGLQCVLKLPVSMF